MSAPAVRVDVRTDAVVVITIDSTESKVNVLTTELWTELETAIDAAAARADIKGLVVASGKPDVFSAGADLHLLEAGQAPNDPKIKAYIELGLRVLDKLDTFPRPTVAAIDGAAFGGGLELALACDSRVGGSNKKIEFGFPEIKYGLIPGLGGTQRLPRLIGLDPAGQLLMTGDPVSLSYAGAVGLLDGTAFTAKLIEAAASLTRDPAESKLRREKRQGSVPLSGASTARVPSPTARTAVRDAFRSMTSGASVSLAEGIKIETAAFLRLAGSVESKRLIGEFFAKKKQT